MPTVYIIFYSLYHHIYTVAKEVQKGLELQGIEVKLFQVPETLNEEVLTKLHAPARPDVPVISVDQLTEADGFMFGIPTRFGTMPAQIKSFFDATGKLWASGALSGKFVGTFFATGVQHGGQETTSLTAVTYFAHHGMNYVPLGFADANLFDNSEVVGGSAYGAGTVTNGDGSRQPSEKELAVARTQGQNFGKILSAYHRGLEKTATNSPAPSQKEASDKPAATATTTTTTTTAEPAAKPVDQAPKEREVKKETAAKPAEPKNKAEEKKKSSCFCM
ncbi:flavoprotein-like protein [Radiomyces spectabilis]|uniref:flavoprotein-like protein n=1 Tax=Radiomyces spectabilis TaxID=64574 RepID=UPI00221FDA63|nr:flavoprotein-like protein [Radiomyces spectabilis]KAI8372932.1 flavoprotein-like protein [Radiomyces spectabilis]